MNFYFKLIHHKIAVIAILQLAFVMSAFAQVPDLKSASDKSQELFDKTNLRVAFEDPLLYVNPFIGTGGHGHTFPGAVVPFGMVQLSPDTRPEGWDGCGGYHYSDSIIYGFSHTHLSGVGVPDYADILIVPQVGKLKLDPSYKVKDGFGASFSHSNEKATAGNYSVRLDNGIQVDLTATERCGIHKYVFPADNQKKYILIDLGYRDKVLEASAKETSKNHVVGFRRSAAWAQNQSIYFDLESNIDFISSKWIVDQKSGKYLMVLEFPIETKEIILRVGTAGTDNLGSAANLKAEVPTWDFYSYTVLAASKWRTELSKIQAKTTDKTVLTNFYTALYHSFIHPSVWSDVDGRYRDFNQKIQQSSTPLFSVFSLWDTYRGANPLYTIVQPKRVQEFIESFRLQYENTGLLPMWTLSNNETNCMIGYHSTSVIADAHAKGIEINDEEGLLLAMIASSNFNHLGKKAYGEQGFISANDEAESVSKTLEYAYDDWCISQFAKGLGNDSIAEIYSLRSFNWMNVWNPETGFFQPRNGGLWLPNFKPNEVNHHFTEANAWQYSLAAPQHIQTLVALKGNAKSMERFLDSLFQSSSQMSGREQSDITGLIGQYAHVNEPSHHMAFAYNYCGTPHKTQFYCDKIMREEYRNAPDGLAGNEDCGQMSAWYVLNAMGFYPMSPGSATYSIGRPLLDKVSIQTGKSAFVIETINNSTQNKYIQSIRWNGEVYSKLYITHDMIQKGGKLSIEMGIRPQILLGTYATDLNEKMNEDFVPVPYFSAVSSTFSESIVVGIEKLPQEQGKIVYSLNDGPFKVFEELTTKNLIFHSTTSLRAKVIRESNGKTVESKEVKTVFKQIQIDKIIDLKTEFANQYGGNGATSLVDGQFGTTEYRSTDWLGFQGKDVEAILTLNEEKEISSVAISALQDTRSWIFFPKSFSIQISLDGTTYSKLQTSVSKVNPKEEQTSISQLKIDFPPSKAKYIKIRVSNFGICPDWHLGAGGQSWIFLDEITIK